MFISALMLLVVLLIISYILHAWFAKNPRPWAKYVYLGLAVLWLWGIFLAWKAYAH